MSELLVFGNYYIYIAIASTHSLCYSLPLPWDLTPSQVEDLDLLGAKQVAAYVGYEHEDEVKMIRTAVGRALGEFIEKAKKAERKLYLTSAHDTTILPLLIALEIYDRKWPDYCAYLAFELWENHAASGGINRLSDRLQMRVVYNGNVLIKMPLRDFEVLVRGEGARCVVSRWLTANSLKSFVVRPDILQRFSKKLSGRRRVNCRRAKRLLSVRRAAQISEEDC